jgi:hypothetical protein
MKKKKKAEKKIKKISPKEVLKPFLILFLEEMSLENIPFLRDTLEKYQQFVQNLVQYSGLKEKTFLIW